MENNFILMIFTMKGIEFATKEAKRVCVDSIDYVEDKRKGTIFKFKDNSTIAFFPSYNDDEEPEVSMVNSSFFDDLKKTNDIS
jgi:hypothetical protein